jgi:hypothetical protein
VAAVGIAGALALAASAGGPAVAQGPEGQAEGAREASVAAVEARAEEAGDRLGVTIDRAIRAGGPFFTAEERAVIERACGYPAGSWDGYSANMHNRSFVCSDGRRVDSAEVRAVMDAAGPRIGARVEAAMDSAGVREALERVASEAAAAAMAGIDHEEITREAMAEARRAVADSHREIEAATREADERRARRR